MRARDWGLDGLLWALLLSLGALTFFKQVTLCQFPYQVEPTEGGMLQCAQVLAEGGDPWAPDIAPESYNAYGLGFPWVAAQWHRFQAGLPWLLLLRLVSVVGALACAGWAALALRDGGASVLESAALAVLLYPVVLFPDSFAARPDALGTALYLGALVVALRPGVWAAVFAAALGVAAFYVKAYFALALPSAFVMLWVQGRRRDAWSLAGSGVVIGAGLAALIAWRHPHYFEGTLLVNAGARELAERSWAWAGRQIRDLFKVHGALAVGVAASLVWAALRGRSLRPLGPALAWSAAAVVAMLALLSGLGGHEGSYLRYYNQLLLGPLLLALSFGLRQLGWSRRALTALLLLNAFFATFTLLGWARPITPQRLQGWAEVRSWVRAHPFGIYPSVMSSVAIEEGAWVTDTGHTYVLKNSRWRGEPTTLAKAAVRRDRWLTQQLVAGRLQSVVCGETWECPPGLGEMGYKQVGEFTMDPPIRFKVYVPRKAPPKPEAYVYVEE